MIGKQVFAGEESYEQKLLISMYEDYDDDDFEVAEETPGFKNNRRKAASKNDGGTTNSSAKQSKLPKVQSRTIEASSNPSDKNHKKSNSIYNRVSELSLPKKANSHQNPIDSSHRNRNQTSNDDEELASQPRPLVAKHKHSESTNIPTFKKQDGTRYDKDPARSGIISKEMHKYARNSNKLTLSVNRTELDKVSLFFAHQREELEAMSGEEISRLNLKIRDWISRMNDDLSYKIQQTLKTRSKQQSANQSPQKIIQLLQGYISNNVGIISLIEREQMKLQGREGEFKEEEYEILLDKEVERMKGVIKEEQKKILKLKKEVALEGNKITGKGGEVAKISKRIESMKLDIRLCRKEYDRNITQLDKVNEQFEQLDKMTKSKDAEIESLTASALQQNILLTDNTKIIDQYNQLKKKADKLKNLKQNTENTASRNQSKLQNELRNIRNEVRQYEEDIKHAEGKIEAVNRQAVAFIEQHSPNKFSNQSQAMNFFNKQESPPRGSAIPNLLKTIEKEKGLTQELKEIRQIRELEDTDMVPNTGRSIWRQLQKQGQNQVREQQNEFMDLTSGNMNEFMMMQKQQLFKPAKSNLYAEINQQSKSHQEKKVAEESSSSIKPELLSKKETQNPTPPTSEPPEPQKTQLFPKKFQLRRNRPKEDKPQDQPSPLT